MRTLPEKVETILFISLSCVGDAIMTTPVLASLHQHFPGASVDIVSDRRSAILYRHCPYLNRILLKDKKKFLRGSVALLKELRKSRYDLIVDLRTDGLAYLCRGQYRFTKWDRRAYGPHAVEQLMGIVRDIHGENPLPASTVWLSEEETSFAQQALSGLPPGRWLEFAPAVALASKAWPVQNYVQLANALTDQFSAIILDGGPAETAVAGAVANGLRLPFVNLAGKTSLLQAAAVLRHASLFVGSDSGLGHVAAAVATPTLTLFSNDTPERVLPWGKNTHWIKASDNNAASISVSEVEARIRTMVSG